MNKALPISLYISLVYVTSVLLRLLLAWQTHDSPLHTLNGEFLSILTYDAALYGHYAKLLLSGLPHTSNVHLVEYVIYYLVTLTPFTLDQVMYYTPAFLSSLIVIPTMLISALYIPSKTIITLLGLISGVGYGYYSRTYLGYLDTDVLNVVFPMFMLYGMILTIRREKVYILIVIISTFLYAHWYHSSLALILVMNGLFLLYFMVSIGYPYVKNSQFKKYYIVLAIATILLSLFLLFQNKDIYLYIQKYLIKDSFITLNNFKFISPMQHLSEAKSTTASLWINHISGNLYLFLLSCAGYVLLVLRHKEMILALPMVVLGLLSLYAGLRFHIYAVAIFIISYFFLFSTAFQYIKAHRSIALIISLLFVIPTFYENYKTVQFWNTKGALPVVYPEQALALQKLSDIKKENDYAVTWWDYGWTMLYYSGLKTMTNNAMGVHSADNYTVAKILLSPSQKFTHHAIHYFYDKFEKNPYNIIVQELRKVNDTEILFSDIETEEIRTKRQVDKYIILPLQMGKLLYTIHMYANIDPLTGQKSKDHIFKLFRKLKEDKNFIYLDNRAKIDKNHSKLLVNNMNFSIKKVDNILYGKEKKIKKGVLLSKQGLHLIVMDDNYYVMDDFFYNSTLVQMMFFNHYDKQYFTPIYEGKSIGIYKVNN